jgi:cation transporter-like permease
MPESDPVSRARRWGAVSIALLVFGLLIALPSGLCVGMLAYGAYVSGASVADLSSGLGGFLFAVATIALLVGLLSIFGAFRSRIDPDDE